MLPKKFQLSISAIFAACAVHAQSPIAIASSQREAVREFPDLSQPDSRFNKRFRERYASLKANHDSLLLRDDWPEVLAREIGVEVGVSAVINPFANVVPSTPSPSPTPWKPMGTSLDDPHQQDDTSLDKPVERFRIVGRVLQKVDAGLLISCDSAPGHIGNLAKGTVLLRDAPMYKKVVTDDPIKCWGSPADNYTYGPGHQISVHSYEYEQ